MFRTFVIAVLAFAAGAIITYLAVVIGTSVVWDIMGVHDQDGGGAMALGLVIGPAIAIIGGVVSAIFVPMWAANRRGHSGPATPAEKHRDIRRFLMIGGALAAGYIGRKIAHLIFWLVQPISIDSFWKVLIITWLPAVMMVLGALIGGWTVHRLTRKRGPKAGA